MWGKPGHSQDAVVDGIGKPHASLDNGLSKRPHIRELRLDSERIP
jgi:hypothetical protein